MSAKGVTTCATARHDSVCHHDLGTALTEYRACFEGASHQKNRRRFATES